MKNGVLWLLLALAACDGQFNVTSNPNGSGINVTFNQYSDTKITCDSSTTGSCHFLLFTEMCEPSKDKSVTCTYDEIERFTLAQGESRVFNKLPPQYRKCTADKPHMTIPECLHPK